MTALTTPRRTASHRVGRLVLRALLLGSLALSLPACNTLQRLSEIGNEPALSPINNPKSVPGYTPVSLPMPAPQSVERNPNSLWRTGSRAFFRDQRAKQVGDLMTVMISISDKAQLQNQSRRARDNKENMGLPNFFGMESAAGRPSLQSLLPGSTPGSLVDLSSAANSNGTGSIDRKEAIDLKVAAIITQVLPNGNLVIQGKQEVRVNYEVRDLNISGVIRPEDITAANTISYEKIAEARIAYGGRGQITDVQQPRYGQQLFDILSPF